MHRSNTPPTPSSERLREPLSRLVGGLSPRRAIGGRTDREARPVRIHRWLACLLAFLGFVASIVEIHAAGIRGLPFSRVYSLEDIGYVPRGSRLAFDAFDRLAVVHDGVYAVLNDTTWMHIPVVSDAARVAMATIARGHDGVTYYGALGSWGRIETQSDGRLRAILLSEDQRPDWTHATTFEDLLVTRDGVYFASRHGLVHRDTRTRNTRFFELPRTSKVFRLGEKVYVSRFANEIQFVDVAAGIVRDVPRTGIDGIGTNVVEHATSLDDDRALLTLLDGTVVVFDGTIATPWPGLRDNGLSGRITELQRLADGNIAVCIAERGVYVLEPEGRLLASLTIPQYHRVSDVASREPGVMWLINEDSIEKVLYDSNLTSFGQRLGISPEWPLPALWNDKLLVASNGTLYEAHSAPRGSSARFERLPNQPPNGAWSLASTGEQVLVGNNFGLYALGKDYSYTPIAEIAGVTHLVMIDGGRCYAVGRSEVALFVWNGTSWIEPYPRVAGVRNPYIAHASSRSAWVESGGDGVARISHDETGIHVMEVRNETWTDALWVNVGSVGDVVVLSGAQNNRRFFDEVDERWCERPDLDRLLNRSPIWLARVRRDAAGNLWATHNAGVIRFTPRGDDYEMDAVSYDLINDRYPIVHVLADDEVWITASRSLYHVETPDAPETRPLREPRLVSLKDGRSNTEWITSPSRAFEPLRFSSRQNDLTFQFFSGTYASRRSPDYEFRLDPAEPWSAFGTGSTLRFPGLREGVYDLHVRAVGQPDQHGPSLIVPFEVLPPWHRTHIAYALFTVFIALAAFAVFQWVVHLTRARSRALEQLVRERTRQLESTMRKLNEETRITATLAERNRLAGEIHDSVQQGLSGAILQLDTTLTLSSLSDNLRSRLAVARNMVSYARQEVQHAVWDMDSPLLESGNLGDALRTIAGYVATGPVAPKVIVSGTPVELPRASTHHLLRIAQEATTNALRHGDAHEIVIRLEYHPHAVVLSVSDDGTGFLPDTVLNQAGHFGLRGMRTRARKLGGSLEVTSSPGHGTTIRLEVPVASDPSSSRDAENTHPHEDPHPARR
jgi:signal transduction histidine kinase